MESLLEWFLSPLGLFLLAVLDSSVVFFLPLALDLVVVLLAARQPELFWLFPLLATAGSLVGAGATHWIGARVGDATLPKLVGQHKLDALVARLEKRGALVAGAAGLIPPPFPFTAYVIAAGALGIDRLRFLAVLAGARLVRTGTAAWVATRYGEEIQGWRESTSFEAVVAITIAIAILGTGWGVWRAWRGVG